MKSLADLAERIGAEPEFGAASRRHDRKKPNIERAVYEKIR
jgi:hypothetical protein